MPASKEPSSQSMTAGLLTAIQVEIVTAQTVRDRASQDMFRSATGLVDPEDLTRVVRLTTEIWWWQRLEELVASSSSMTDAVNAAEALLVEASLTVYVPPAWRESSALEVGVHLVHLEALLRFQLRTRKVLDDHQAAD